MTARNTLELLIELMSRLKSALEIIVANYELMMPVVDQEHVSIRKADLNQLEVITERKIELGQKIADEGHNVLLIAEEVRRTYDYFVSIEERISGKSIHDTIERIVYLKTKLAEEGLAVEVLDHLIVKVRGEVEKLSTLKTTTDGKVKVNTAVTKELLRHHQENIRLIQSVIEQCESTYDATGLSKKRDSKGILQVKV